MVYPHLKFDLAEAKEQPIFDLCEAVWSAVADACGQTKYGANVEPYVYLLPEPWRIAYAVHDLEGYVLGGGFISYFDTHTKLLHQEALNGFSLIGAKKHHEIVRQAFEMQDDEEALRELDSLFYDYSMDDPRQLLARYIIDHFAAYSKPKQNRLTWIWRAVKLQLLKLKRQA